MAGDRSFKIRYGGTPTRLAAVHGSLTFAAVPAAEVKVGLVAVSVSSTVQVDRRQPLHCDHRSAHSMAAGPPTFRAVRFQGSSTAA